MKKWMLVPLLLAAAACSAAAERKSLSQVMEGGAWTEDEGGVLNTTFQTDIASALQGLKSDDALSALKSAGYRCDSGADATTCVRKFQTRACAVEWRVAVTNSKAKVGAANGAFARDCTNDERDFPAGSEFSQAHQKVDLATK